MNASAEKEAFYMIGGQKFDRRALLSHCAGIRKDSRLPDWKKEVMDFIAAFLDPGAPRIMQQTSGTTGPPKKMVLNRDAMVNSADRTIRYFGLKPGERTLLCLPVEYIAARMMIVRALVGGLDLVMAAPSSRPLRTLDRGRIRFASMVPLQVHDSMDHGDDLSRLDILLIGGGEIHSKLKDRLVQLQKPLIFESFATTETYSHFALRKINGTDAGSTFRVMEGVTVKKDRLNRLMVEIPGVTDGIVQTGDLVEIMDGGRSFRWLGRFDHVINSGGKKIIPEQLEDQVRRITGHECLAVPGPDKRLGQQIVLIIESEGNAPIAEWMALFREHLEPHQRPARIIQVREIPRNQSFKPDRRAAARLIGPGT